MRCAPGPERRPGESAARRASLFGAALAALAASGTTAGAELPSVFEGITVGVRWDEVAPDVEATSLDHLTSEWEHHARACGYATQRVVSEQGDLIVIVQDHVVVEVSHALPIPPGSDVRTVASGLIERYGQPERAEMRDGLGGPTLGDGVSTVVLEYAGEHPVRFAVFGDALWQYTVTIRHRDSQWHENRNLRCARERQRAAATR